MRQDHITSNAKVTPLVPNRENRHPTIALLGAQTVAMAKIPAGRALAEIPANGAHGANLRTGDAPGCLREGRELGTNGCVFEEFVHGNERADGHSFGVRMDAV